MPHRAARTPALAALSLICALAGPALAAPALERLRGTIEAAGDGAFTLRTTDGRAERIDLAPDVRISWVVPASLDRVRDGTYIGTATRGEPPVAIEVVLFPESMRGTGEGRQPWDAIPDRAGDGAPVASAMTNGTVTAAAPAAPDAPAQTTMTNGTVRAGGGAERTLTVDYGQGRSVQILVPPRAPVVTFEPADRAAVAPGAHAFVVVAREGDRVTARRVAVGRDGLVPPM